MPQLFMNISLEVRYCSRVTGSNSLFYRGKWPGTDAVVATLITLLTDASLTIIWVFLCNVYRRSDWMRYKRRLYRASVKQKGQSSSWHFMHATTDVGPPVVYRWKVSTHVLLKAWSYIFSNFMFFRRASMASGQAEHNRIIIGCSLPPEKHR